MLKNLVIPENGGSLFKFTSEYHHESKCKNLLNRDPTLVWFTDINEPLPQHVIFKFSKPCVLEKVGIFIHGENNQNPADLKIYLSKESSKWLKVVDDELEHRAKDNLYDLSKEQKKEKWSFVKYEVSKNFGGSGIHISKCFAFGREAEIEKKKE